MKKEEFKSFVDETLENVIRLAEEKTGRTLSRKVCFHWGGHESERVCQDVSEYIIRKVYIDEDHIYPCVDIGVADVLDDGTVLISANIAGYSPGPFQKNWTGRDGPFVYIIWERVFDKLGRV